MIETKGYCAIIEAADVMLKTSQVKLVALERIGSSLLTVMGVGDVGAVESAVAAGCEHAKKLGEENGRFSSIEEIKNIDGIADKTYEKLKDQITVN